VETSSLLRGEEVVVAAESPAVNLRVQELGMALASGTHWELQGLACVPGKGGGPFGPPTKQWGKCCFIRITFLLYLKLSLPSPFGGVWAGIGGFSHRMRD
jgi:hypothetical protein